MPETAKALFTTVIRHVPSRVWQHCSDWWASVKHRLWGQMWPDSLSSWTVTGCSLANYRLQKPKQWLTLALQLYVSGGGSVPAFQAAHPPSRSSYRHIGALKEPENLGVGMACRFHLDMTTIVSLALFNCLPLQSCALLHLHYMPCLFQAPCGKPDYYKETEVWMRVKLRVHRSFHYNLESHLNMALTINLSMKVLFLCQFN